MLKNKTVLGVLIALFIAVSMSACGQKGDLYLPEGMALVSWLS